MSAYLYLEHLTGVDLNLIATVSGVASAADLLADVHSDPGYLETLLVRPSLFQALFGSGEGEAFLRASPFLVFATLVHRASHDLEELPYVHEWVGPDRRVPMFEIGPLRDFVGDPLRRLFLSELLASYTRVASGAVWTRTARGWRRRRFSELDPVRLVEMLDVVPENEKSGVYRRLGDVSLFLTGVFPDYAAGRLLPGLQRRRLERALDRRDTGSPGLTSGDIHLLEQLGRRSYHLASRAAEPPSGMSRVLAEVAEGFEQARRLLNVLTDRYLFPFRERWFPTGGS
ncbi:MAG: hypothetical protein ACR2JC_04930 [Chloroflexota bacterium]